MHCQLLLPEWLHHSWLESFQPGDVLHSTTARALAEGVAASTPTRTRMNSSITTFISAYFTVSRRVRTFTCPMLWWWKSAVASRSTARVPGTYLQPVGRRKVLLRDGRVEDGEIGDDFFLLPQFLLRETSQETGSLRIQTVAKSACNRSNRSYYSINTQN